MQTRQTSNSTARVLRIALVAEVVFLVLSAFFLFTEHRAHYLGALPYALLVIAVTVFVWLSVERGKQHSDSVGNANSPRQKGGQYHA